MGGGGGWWGYKEGASEERWLKKKTVRWQIKANLLAQGRAAELEKLGIQNVARTRGVFFFVFFKWVDSCAFYAP